MSTKNQMPFSLSHASIFLQGDRLLSIIDTKFLHLLNFMKLVPYSVDYAFLRHPEMCKHNTQFIQQLLYFGENLSAAPMVMCDTVVDIKWRQSPGSFVVASLRSAENAHRKVGTGKYELRKPFTPHSARASSRRWSRGHRILRKTSLSGQDCKLCEVRS